STVSCSRIAAGETVSVGVASVVHMFESSPGAAALAPRARRLPAADGDAGRARQGASGAGSDEIADAVAPRAYRSCGETSVPHGQALDSRAEATGPANAWTPEPNDMGSTAWTRWWLDDDPLEGLIEQHGFALAGVTPPDADDLPGWTPSAEAAALLAGADLGVMSDGELVETVALWGRVVAWAQAQQMRAAAELDTRPAMRPRWSPKAGRVSRPHVTAEELAARLACSRHAAQSLVRSGRAFRGALAPTGDALTEGLID